MKVGIIQKNYKLIKNTHIILFLSIFCLFLSFFDIFNIGYKNKIISTNIVFTIDISKSMDALDYNGFSRLDKSKDFIKHYITKNPNNKYGLIVFAGNVKTILTLTDNLDIFLANLELVSSNMLYGGGTNIKGALEQSLERFNQEEGYIFLLSDFEVPGLENINNYLYEIGYLKQNFIDKNIALFNIGLGDENGSKIVRGYDFFGDKMYEVDHLNRDIITVFDRIFFDKMSQILNAFSYYIAQNTSYNNLSSQINRDISKNISYNNSTQINLLFILSYIIFIYYIILYFYTKKNENKIINN